MAVYPIPASREEWLKLRRNYIGSSEIAILFGLQKDSRDSLYTLYHQKIGEAPDKDLSGNDRVEDGTLFEPVILQSAARREGWTLRPGVFAVDDVCPGMAATLDAVLLPGQEDERRGFVGPGAGEAKMVGWDVYMEEWDGDEPPAYFLLQLQHHLACSGYQWGAIPALIGGRYWCRRYVRDDLIISAIREKVSEFQDMVRTRTPPPVDHRKSTRETLKRKFPRPDKSLIIDMTGDNELPDLFDKCVRLGKEKDSIERELEEAKNLVRERLAENHKYLLAGGRIVRRSVGADTPDRVADPGELIKGRKGKDALYFTEAKEKAA